MKPYDKSNSFMRRVTKRVSEYIPGMTWMNTLISDAQTDDDRTSMTGNDDQPPVKKLCTSNNSFTNTKYPPTNSTDNHRGSKISAVTCIPSTSKQSPKFTSQSSSPLGIRDTGLRAGIRSKPPGYNKRKCDVVDLSNITRPGPTTVYNFASSTPTIITATNQPLKISLKRSLNLDNSSTSNEFLTPTSSKLIKPRENESHQQSSLKFHDTSTNHQVPLASFRWDPFVNYGELSERQKLFAQKSPLNCSQVMYGGSSARSSLSKTLGNTPPIHRKAVIPISSSNNSEIRTTSSILLEHISTKNKEIEENKFIIQPKVHQRHKAVQKNVPIKVESTIKIVETTPEKSDSKSSEVSSNYSGRVDSNTTRKLRVNLSKKGRVLKSDELEMPTEVNLPKVSLSMTSLPSIDLSNTNVEDNEFSFNQPLTIEQFISQIVEKTSRKKHKMTLMKAQNTNIEINSKDQSSTKIPSLKRSLNLDNSSTSNEFLTPTSSKLIKPRENESHQQSSLKFHDTSTNHQVPLASFRWDPFVNYGELSERQKLFAQKSPLNCSQVMYGGSSARSSLSKTLGNTPPIHRKAVIPISSSNNSEIRTTSSILLEHISTKNKEIEENKFIIQPKVHQRHKAVQKNVPIKVESTIKIVETTPEKSDSKSSEVSSNYSGRVDSNTTRKLRVNLSKKGRVLKSDELEMPTEVNLPKVSLSMTSLPSIDLSNTNVEDNEFSFNQPLTIEQFISQIVEKTSRKKHKMTLMKAQNTNIEINSKDQSSTKIPSLKRSLNLDNSSTSNEFLTPTSSKLIKPRENESHQQSSLKFHDTSTNHQVPLASFRWDPFVNYGELSERQKLFAQKSPLNCSQVMYGGSSARSSLSKTLGNTPPIHRKAVIPISSSNNSEIRTTSSILLEHISTKNKEIEENKFIIQPKVHQRHKAVQKNVPIKVESTIKIVETTPEKSDSKSSEVSSNYSGRVDSNTTRKLRVNLSKKGRVLKSDELEMPTEVNLPKVSLSMTSLPSIDLSNTNVEDNEFSFNQPLTIEQFISQIVEKTSRKKHKMTLMKAQNTNIEINSKDQSSTKIPSLKRSLNLDNSSTSNEFLTPTSSKLIKPRENESHQQSSLKFHDTSTNHQVPLASFRWDPFVNYGELSERQKLFAQKSPLNCSQVMYGGSSARSSLSKTLGNTPPIHRKAVIPISSSNNSEIRTTSSILLEHISTKNKEIEENKFIIQPKVHQRHKAVQKNVPIKVESTIKIVETTPEKSDSKSSEVSSNYSGRVDSNTTRKLRVNLSKKGRVLKSDELEMPTEVNLPKVSLSMTSLPSIDLSNTNVEDNEFSFNQPLTIEQFISQIVEKTSRKKHKMTLMKAQNTNIEINSKDQSSTKIPSLKRSLNLDNSSTSNEFLTPTSSKLIKPRENESHQQSSLKFHDTSTNHQVPLASFRWDPFVNYGELSERQKLFAQKSPLNCSQVMYGGSSARSSLSKTLGNTPPIHRKAVIPISSSNNSEIRTTSSILLEHISTKNKEIEENKFIIQPKVHQRHKAVQTNVPIKVESTIKIVETTPEKSDSKSSEVSSNYSGRVDSNTTRKLRVNLSKKGRVLKSDELEMPTEVNLPKVSLSMTSLPSIDLSNTNVEDNEFSFNQPLTIEQFISQIVEKTSRKKHKMTLMKAQNTNIEINSKDQSSTKIPSLKRSLNLDNSSTSNEFLTPTSSKLIKPRENESHQQSSLKFHDTSTNHQVPLASFRWDPFVNYGELSERQKLFAQKSPLNCSQVMYGGSSARSSLSKTLGNTPPIHRKAVIPISSSNNSEIRTTSSILLEHISTKNKEIEENKFIIQPKVHQRHKAVQTNVPIKVESTIKIVETTPEKSDSKSSEVSSNYSGRVDSNTTRKLRVNLSKKGRVLKSDELEMPTEVNLPKVSLSMTSLPSIDLSNTNVEDNEFSFNQPLTIEQFISQIVEKTSRKKHKMTLMKAQNTNIEINSKDQSSTKIPSLKRSLNLDNSSTSNEFLTPTSSKLIKPRENESHQQSSLKFHDTSTNHQVPLASFRWDPFVNYGELSERQKLFAQKSPLNCSQVMYGGSSARSSLSKTLGNTPPIHRKAVIPISSSNNSEIRTTSSILLEHISTKNKEIEENKFIIQPKVHQRHKAVQKNVPIKVESTIKIVETTPEKSDSKSSEVSSNYSGRVDSNTTRKLRVNLSKKGRVLKSDELEMPTEVNLPKVSLSMTSLPSIDLSNTNVEDNEFSFNQPLTIEQFISQIVEKTSRKKHKMTLMKAQNTNIEINSKDQSSTKIPSLKRSLNLDNSSTSNEFLTPTSSKLIKPRENESHQQSSLKFHDTSTNHQVPLASFRWDPFVNYGELSERQKLFAQKSPLNCSQVMYGGSSARSSLSKIFGITPPILRKAVISRYLHQIIVKLEQLHLFS